MEYFYAGLIFLLLCGVCAGLFFMYLNKQINGDD